MPKKQGKGVETAVSVGQGAGRPPTEATGAGWNPAHYFLLALLVVVLGASLHLLAAYGHTILLAIILGTVFSPVHRRLVRLTRGREDFAALCSCLLLTLVVVLPLLLVFLSLIHQGIDSFDAIHAWIKAGEYQKLIALPWVTKAWAVLAPYMPDLSKYIPELGAKAKPLNQTVLDLTSRVGGLLVSQGVGLAGNLGALIGKFFLLLFTFYFVVRDEERISRHLLHLLPLSASQEGQMVAKIKAVARSVLLGTLFTALAQGAAGGLAFWFTGLPGLFWGSMMAFAALIPFVGTALIWLPATVYLLIIGRWQAALFMAIWCGGVVGMLDNFLRPLFMKGGADMSPMLIFFAILGGVNTFGLLGLLYGPLLFGLSMVLLYLYEMEFAPFLNRQDRS
jgi:predicted PurR-regulated permease PerM